MGSRKMGDWEERRKGKVKSGCNRKKTIFTIKKNDWSKKTTQFYEQEVT